MAQVGIRGGPRLQMRVIARCNEVLVPDAVPAIDRRAAAPTKPT